MSKFFDNTTKFLLITTIALVISLGFLPKNSVTIKHTTIVEYKGQLFILYGFKGEGYTRQNHIPVYSPVFIPLKDQQKYEKK